MDFVRCCRTFSATRAGSLAGLWIPLLWSNKTILIPMPANTPVRTTSYISGLTCDVRAWYVIYQDWYKYIKKCRFISYHASQCINMIYELNIWLYNSKIYQLSLPGPIRPRLNTSLFHSKPCICEIEFDILIVDTGLLRWWRSHCIKPMFILMSVNLNYFKPLLLHIFLALHISISNIKYLFAWSNYKAT